MLKKFHPANIRTITPAAYGAIIAWLAGHNANYVHVLAFFEKHLGGRWDGLAPQGATVVVIGLYYVFARKLEEKYPSLGKYLLGSTSQPSYAPLP